MYYFFDDVLAHLKSLPDFSPYSDPAPKCPKSADVGCTSGYKTCADGMAGRCVQYFSYSVNSSAFSLEIKFYDSPKTNRGLVLGRSAALLWLLNKGLVDESTLTQAS